MSFSTKSFIQYIIEHASNMTRLLQTYYDVSVQLDILALTTRYLMAHIPELDEPLCDLFLYQDKVGQGKAIREKIDQKNNVVLHSLYSSA